MIDFGITSASIIEFYKYRTAKVAWSIKIKLEQSDIDKMRSYIKDNDYKPDNHICWKDSRGTCFWYMDRILYIGTKIIVKDY